MRRAGGWGSYQASVVVRAWKHQVIRAEGATELGEVLENQHIVSVFR